MFDIITFGSATRDIFIESKDFLTLKSKKFITGRGICLNFGSKIEIKDMFFASGGGGTNAAATFSKQGFKTAYCGALGNDIAGASIIDELKRFKVETGLIKINKKKPTNHSIILSSGEEGRTILVYRGASEELSNKDIPWSKLKARWFYLAPLLGKLSFIFKDLVDFAKRNNIKVAVNPGNTQLLLPGKTLRGILKKIDILILNQEEASLLTNIPFKKTAAIFKKIDKICPGIAIMTKGKAGVVVSDGKYLYQADSLKTKVVDMTGAGDAFSAGFLSGFMRSKGDIKTGIQLGIANSASCISEWGTKNGLLDKDQSFKKISVKKWKII